MNSWGVLELLNEWSRQSNNDRWRRITNANVPCKHDRKVLHSKALPPLPKREVQAAKSTDILTDEKRVFENQMRTNMAATP